MKTTVADRFSIENRENLNQLHKLQSSALSWWGEHAHVYSNRDVRGPHIDGKVIVRPYLREWQLWSLERWRLDRRLPRSQVGAGERARTELDKLCADGVKRIEPPDYGLVLYGFYTDLIALLDDNGPRAPQYHKPMARVGGKLAFATQMADVSDVLVSLSAILLQGMGNERQQVEDKLDQVMGFVHKRNKYGFSPEKLAILRVLDCWCHGLDEASPPRVELKTTVIYADTKKPIWVRWQIEDHGMPQSLWYRVSLAEESRQEFCFAKDEHHPSDFERDGLVEDGVIAVPLLRTRSAQSYEVTLDLVVEPLQGAARLHYKRSLDVVPWKEHSGKLGAAYSGLHNRRAQELLGYSAPVTIVMGGEAKSGPITIMHNALRSHITHDVKVVKEDELPEDVPLHVRRLVIVSERPVTIAQCSEWSGRYSNEIRRLAIICPYREELKAIADKWIVLDEEMTAACWATDSEKMVETALCPPMRVDEPARKLILDIIRLFPEWEFPYQFLEQMAEYVRTGPGRTPGFPYLDRDDVMRVWNRMNGDTEGGEGTALAQEAFVRVYGKNPEGMQVLEALWKAAYDEEAVKCDWVTVGVIKNKLPELTTEAITEKLANLYDLRLIEQNGFLYIPSAALHHALIRTFWEKI